MITKDMLNALPLWCQFQVKQPLLQGRIGVPDLGQLANLKLVDKQGKELVELKLQVLA